MMTRGRLLMFCLLPIATVLACTQTEAGPPPAPGSMVVRKGDLVQSFTLSGEIRSRDAQVISVPPLPEWNTTVQWLAEDGSLVAEGDRVVELDNTSFASTIDAQRLAVTQALNELTRFDATSTTQVQERQFEYERRKIDLDKAKVAAAVPQEIVSRREWEDAQLALQRAETEFRKAEELLRSASTGRAAERANLELDLTAARRQLSRSEQAIEALILRAPTEGVFLLRDHPWEGRRFQVGDRVFVGLPIAEMPDPSNLVVEANLWDVDDGRISKGQDVEVVVDAWPERSWKGRVTAVAPVAQEAERQSLRRSFRTIVELDEIDPERMRPGYSVRVTARKTLARDTLLVPRSSVTRSGNEASITTADGRRRNISLGPCNAQECAVTEGIREGERLSRAEVQIAETR